jgi:6-methylsalicylate decarboxylase
MPAHSPATDFHAHFVPDFYRDAATRAGYGSPDGIAGFPHWSVDEALGMMDRNGITVAVASVSSPGVHFGDDAAARQLARTVNEFNAGVTGKHPDRFAVLASLPLPDIEGALAEITYAFDVLHADGVMLETNARGLYLGDPAIEPVLDALDHRQRAPCRLNHRSVSAGARRGRAGPGRGRARRSRPGGACRAWRRGGGRGS